MYCPKCGSPVSAQDSYCPNCGYDLKANASNAPKYVNYGASSLQKIAFIFMILATILQGILIIPLLWCLPMTIKLYNTMNNGEKSTVVFEVCTLLFVSTISGILLLVDGSSN